jgi:tRNA-splicing ligase RtcB (3'-phosphate/5'-hydroxy nucleic acid ligase)
MGKKLNNSELKALGIFHPKLLEAAGKMGKKWVSQGRDKAELLATYQALLASPGDFVAHPELAGLAALVQELQPALPDQMATSSFALRPVPLAFPVYGQELIDPTARQQMETAMKLPVSLAGALMPDAHHGYGLPIGGVLATSANAVIPYAVGVDIACRMCLSVFDVPADYLGRHVSPLKKSLLDHTVFGLDKGFDKPMADDVFDRPEWTATPLIRGLRRKAEAQIGTSGTGNHFVEWGWLELAQPCPELPLPPGKYLALLSHSGSRGFGAAIANHYSKLAMERTKLPREAQHLAWLDLGTAEGQEYWVAMNLAGHYASANHHQVHRRLAKFLGTAPAAVVENHHNFAWPEALPDGTPVIVHRKGATPAGAGVLGIIPGSSAQPGFVVRGRGEAASLQSASHGAGRLMSRSQAKSTIDKKAVRDLLAEKGVTLIGGDLDEAPMVYKDIFAVLESQASLVDILAKFTPKIVRMAEPDKWGRRED